MHAELIQAHLSRLASEPTARSTELETLAQHRAIRLTVHDAQRLLTEHYYVLDENPRAACLLRTLISLSIREASLSEDLADFTGGVSTRPGELALGHDGRRRAKLRALFDRATRRSGAVHSAKTGARLRRIVDAHDALDEAAKASA